MRAALAPAVLLGFIATVGRADAQLAPGVAGTSDAPTVGVADDYWIFVREFGRCLARSKGPQAMAMLRTSRGSAEEAQAFRAMSPRSGNNACMSNVVRASINRAHIRGVVAEALLETQAAAAGSAPALPDAPFAGDIRSLDDFADCYVGRHAAKVRALLADTRLGSRKEASQVQRMAVDFGDCFPAGRDVRIVPTDIRLALAEALYRTGVAPATVVQRSK